jgi:hypothetical protein
MSQKDSRSSGRTDAGAKGDLDRERFLDEFRKAINDILEEKRAFYGDKNSFLESNAYGGYAHALGEAKYKLDEFSATKKLRTLCKAAAWIYLIFETEVHK